MSKFDSWQSYLSVAVLQSGKMEQGHIECGGCALTFEDLYQAIKARLVAELLVDVHGVANFGRLVNDVSKAGDVVWKSPN